MEALAMQAMVLCTVLPTEPNIGNVFHCRQEPTDQMALQSIPGPPIVCISPRGREPLDSTEMAAESFFQKTGGRVGNRFSKRTAIFMTSPSIRKNRMCFMPPVLSPRHGDRQTADYTGSAFPDSISNGDRE